MYAFEAKGHGRIRLNLFQSDKDPTEFDTISLFLMQAGTKPTTKLVAYKSAEDLQHLAFSRPDEGISYNSVIHILTPSGISSGQFGAGSLHCSSMHF